MMSGPGIRTIHLHRNEQYPNPAWSGKYIIVSCRYFRFFLRVSVCKFERTYYFGNTSEPYLKKFYFILSLLLVFTTQSFSQEKKSGTGHDEAPSKMVRFYPNPATSDINFDFTKGYDNSYTFQIYNMMGKKVHEISKVTPRNNVNLNNFFRGIYIFQLKDKNGRVLESGKFQVAK